MQRPAGQVAASFFDGETAARHAVHVSVQPHAPVSLIVEGDTIDGPLSWPIEDVRALKDQAEQDRLVLTYHTETDDESPRDPARLIVDDASLRHWIIATRPNLFKSDVHKGTGRKILVRSGMAIGAVVLMLFVILPAMANTLATLIPIEREVAFGKTITAQMERMLGGERIGALRCEDAEGHAALDRMLTRLTETTPIDYDVEISVFDHGMLNAFAAPGGQVVLLRGLIEQVDGPDALAAVLAHEIAHVESRDPTRGALRAAGSAGLLSMVLGDFTGGGLLVIVADHIFNASYTREAEVAADAYAVNMLNAANVSTDGMVAFFRTLDEMDGDAESLPEYFSTHPHSGDRANRAADGQAHTHGHTQVVSDADWLKIKAMCDA